MSSFSKVSVVDLSSLNSLSNVYPGKTEQHNLTKKIGLQTFLNGGNNVVFDNNLHTLQDILDASNGVGLYSTNNFEFTAKRYPTLYRPYERENIFVWTSQGYRRIFIEDGPEPACDAAFRPTDSDACPFLRFSLSCKLGQVQDALGLQSLQFLIYSQPRENNTTAPMEVSVLANLLTAFFNGPLSGSVDGYGTLLGPSCPCGFPCPSNSSTACVSGIPGVPGDFDYICEIAPWKLLVDSIQVDVNGVPNKQSYIGPCWNPGAGMSVAGGAGPFFQASASVSRILNLDKIQFTTWPTVQPIKCKKTGKGRLLMTLYGYTCASDDTIYGENAEFTIKAAATVNAFGENFGFPCNASPEDGTQIFQSCPYDATRLQDQCMGAKLPGAKISVTLDVPFIPNVPEQRCFFDTGEIGFFDFTQMSVEVDYALDDAPTLLFPEGDVVPPSFQDNMQTIMMEVANTDMRQFIKNYLNGKVAELVKSNEFLQLFECVLNHYQKEWKVCTVFESEGPPINCSGTVPIYPGGSEAQQCSPCDECCLCLQNGDCGPKCRQDCPCIREWCTSSGRNDSNFLALIAASVGVACIVGLIVLYYFVRGLKRPILPLWFPLVET